MDAFGVIIGSDTDRVKALAAKVAETEAAVLRFQEGLGIIPSMLDVSAAHTKIETYLALAELIAMQCAFTGSARRNPDDARRYVNEAQKLIDLLVEKEALWLTEDIKFTLTKSRIVLWLRAKHE